MYYYCELILLFVWQIRQVRKRRLPSEPGGGTKIFIRTLYGEKLQRAFDKTALFQVGKQIAYNNQYFKFILSFGKLKINKENKWLMSLYLVSIYDINLNVYFNHW